LATINGSNRQKTIDLIKDQYVTKDEIVWLYKSSQDAVTTMMLYARKDSASSMKANQLYNDLRQEMFKMMIGRDRGGDLPNMLIE
jgi:hypothetical protein